MKDKCDRQTCFSFLIYTKKIIDSCYLSQNGKLRYSLQAIKALGSSIRKDNIVYSFFTVGKAKNTPKRMKYPIGVLGMKGKGSLVLTNSTLCLPLHADVSLSQASWI